MTGNDSIFAVSSGKGPAAIAVIRVSGPHAGAAVEALTGGETPVPGRARRVRLADPSSGEWLDDGLALWFRGPRSNTGEDVLELHVHGGRAVISGVVEVLARLPGLRPAEPGEFSRRAFENGKFDLTAAEAVADLVDAETATQRRQALEQMDGGLARCYDGWRERLIKSLAHMEADIDFPDDGLPEDLAAAWRADMLALEGEIAGHLNDDRRGERIRDGFYVAIVGAPNVGKSSLLNRLAIRDAAIVSETKGTTRDVIEVHLDLGGFPVILADTAGLRESADSVESEGVRRARARAEGADLRLAVFDATTLPTLHEETVALVNGDSLAVVNKWDLAAAGCAQPVIGPRPAIAVSALTGAGMDGLAEEIGTELARRWSPPEAPALTRARHRRALEECREALGRAQNATLAELAAEDVRLALRALGRITGRVDVEDVLDAIFRNFCIGK